MSKWRIGLIVLMLAFLCGCLGVPKNVNPVDGFDLNKYLGKWYEIARLDHSFERGLNNVTAEYSLRWFYVPGKVFLPFLDTRRISRR